MDLRNVKNTMNNKRPQGQQANSSTDVIEEIVIEKVECLGILWRTDADNEHGALINQHIVVREDLFFWAGRDAILVYAKKTDYKEAVSLLLTFYFEKIKEWKSAYIETDCSDYGKELVFRLASFGVGISVREGVEGYNLLNEHIEGVSDYLNRESKLFKDNFDTANHKNSLYSKKHWLEKIQYI